MKQYISLSDKELAHSIKQDEKDAFRELYDRYSPRIFRFAQSYLKNNDDSEELVQNTFLKIWENREILNTEKNIKAFIFKIAVNTIYDFIRRKNIEQAYVDYQKLNFSPDENYTWHSVIYEEMLQNLQELMKQMPEQQRAIFQLSKIDGLSNDEIAQKLNLSKRTVENHLYRAISYLKTNFQDKSIVMLLFFYLICS